MRFQPTPLRGAGEAQTVGTPLAQQEKNELTSNC
jgi:hypothetical protein